MKYIVILLSLFSLTIISAQDVAVSDQTSTLLRASTNNNGMGIAFFYTNPNRAIDGTVYLFEDWDNNGIIHATNHQKFAIYNINLNIKRNSFESKVGRDSLFAFNFNNIEKFVINNRVFKNYYWDDDNRVYEVISESKHFEILKGFKVKFVEGSSNPMLNRANDKYVRDEKYYLRKDDKIAFFVLKKSRILKLLDLNDQQKDKVLNYVSEQKLSYKNEDDIKKIIEFGLNNKS